MGGNLSLRDARRQWIESGGSVVNIRRTGEERYTHPRIARKITVNKRRKDTPRKLQTALAKLRGREKPDS